MRRWTERPLSRRGRWRRTVAARVVSAVLAGAAVWVIASAWLPRPPDPGVPVVVAARDLALGQTVGATDLRLERRPQAYVPSGAVGTAETAVGRVLGGPVLAGEVVTTARFRGSAALAALPAGTLAVSVAVADSGLVAALRPADLVTVLAVGSGETVAASAPVLSSDVAPSGVLGGSTSAGARVLLALTPAEAKSLAAAIGAPTAAGFVLGLHR